MSSDVERYCSVVRSGTTGHLSMFHGVTQPTTVHVFNDTEEFAMTNYYREGVFRLPEEMTPAEFREFTTDKTVGETIMECLKHNPQPRDIATVEDED